MLIEGALTFVYAPMYDREAELRCIVRVPSGSSTARTYTLASQRIGVEIRTNGTMSDAEAETLIEMGCCPLLNFTNEEDIEDVMSMQGFRDEDGNRIKWRYED